MCEFEMDLKNFFCLRSNLSNLCTFCLKARSEMDTDFRGLVWKRMGKISRNWAAHPHQEFPGVPLPLPPGSKATRTLTSWTSWKATGSLISRLIERSCLIQWIWMPLFCNSHCTNLSGQSTEREKKSNFRLLFLKSGTPKFSLLTR